MALVVYGYGRVSTAKQEAGLQAQKEQCKAYFDYRFGGNKDATWGGWYEDESVSGKIPIEYRAAGEKLMKRLARGDHLVVTKTDRAFRSMVDQVLTIETLLKRGINLHFLDIGADASTPIGRLMLHMLGGFAEFERRRIGERTREAIRERKKNGLAHSGLPPYGFRRERRESDGKAIDVIDRHEITIMKRAYELRLDGATYEDIWRAFRLHKKTRNRKGGELALQFIWKFLKRYQEMLTSGQLPDYALPGVSSSAPKTASTPTAPTP